MAVNTVNNRQILSSFRATLNTWAAAINQSITDIASLTTSVGNKQNANAISTLNFNVTNTATNYTLSDTDVNNIILVTNAGATTFTLPITSSFAMFRTGCLVIISNNPASTNTVTLTPSGTTLIGTAAITTGTTAFVVMTGVNTYKRLI